MVASTNSDALKQEDEDTGSMGASDADVRSENQLQSSDSDLEKNRRSTRATIDYAYANDTVGDKGPAEESPDDTKGPPSLLEEDANTNPQAVGESEYSALIGDSKASILGRSITVDHLSQRSLSNDTFSFLIYTRNLSRPSLLAALVFFLQIAIFALVLVDVIDPSNKKNPLNFPVNVESTVRATEVLAIAVAIITQDDVRKAINLLRDGFQEDYFRDTLGSDVSKSKWILSIVLRGCEGSLGLFVTFMLIMQSETVLDLLLNFSAMEFVSLIDDVAFSLSTEGFFGYMMQREAKALSEMKYRVAHEGDTWKASLLTSIYFIVLFGTMLTGWGIIFANQASGKYMCGQLSLQLDDALVPSLGMLSGKYYVNRHLSVGGRVTAYQDWSRGMVGYCKDDKMWTVVIRKEGVEPNLCKDWIAASSESMSFDLTEMASSQSHARTKSGRVLLIDHTYIGCYDCKDEENFCGESYSHGTCDDTCICDKGRYGLRCEFEEPCSVLEVDPRSTGFVGNDKALASKYYLATGYDRYDRPVYASSLGENPYRPVGDVDIISFIGRRWAVTSGGMPISPDAESVSFIHKEPSFISEAVDIDGRVDMVAYPLGLEWHPSLAAPDNHIRRPDLSHSIDVTLICALCNNRSNPCLYNGTCRVDGSCDCAHGTTGTLCQIPPTSNGHCDPYFNNADFEYDGGDCCESSCVSTDEFTCGKDDSGYVDVGYFHCDEAEKEQWISGGNSVHGVNSAARSGTAISLGGNGGTVLAVGDPGASVVRLFDKDGSNWVQRGQALEGPPNYRFGLAVSISDPGNAMKNAFSSPGVMLAVGAPGVGLVRVYQCLTNGCVQVGSDISKDISEFGVSVSLSNDGMMVAVGAESYMYDVVIYKNSHNETGSRWEQHGNLISITRRKLAMFRSISPGYYISLAGDGEAIAIGSILAGSSSSEKYDSSELMTRVYIWAEVPGEWLLVGDEISKKLYLYDTPRSVWPLRPVVLSDDARVLAMGSSRAVDVYVWDESMSNWMPREVDLNITESMGLAGWSVDLSADGSTLAIGTSIENQNANSDSIIRVHKWNGTHYGPFLNGVPAGETSAVSLSRDGKALAVGLPFSGKKGGSTMVYKLQPSSECDSNYQLFRVSFTTDGYPAESRWTLQIDSSKTVESKSYDGFPFTTFVEEICVPKDSCIKLRVFDSVGNGIYPPGVYSLMLDSEEVARGHEFEFGEIKHIGNCDSYCPEGTSLLSITAKEGGWPMEWALSRPNQTLIGEYQFRLPMDNTVEIFEECIPKDGCWFITNPRCDTCDIPSVPYAISFYDITYNGTSHTGSDYGSLCMIIILGECSSNEEAVAEQVYTAYETQSHISTPFNTPFPTEHVQPFPPNTPYPTNEYTRPPVPTTEYTRPPVPTTEYTGPPLPTSEHAPPLPGLFSTNSPNEQLKEEGGTKRNDV